MPYFLWKRAWAALAGCAAGLILFWWLLPGLVLGFERNDRLFAEWADNMIVPYVVHGKVTTEHQNQSLPGLVHRLLTRGPSFSEWDDAIRGYVPVEYDNILDVHPALAGLLVKFCMAAFAAAVVWSCRTPIAQRQRSQLAAEYALVVLGMLLFSERTWKHHCVSLVLPLAVLAYRLADGRVPARGRRAIVAALATAWLLMTLTGTGLFGSALDHVARIFEVYGTYVWAYVVLAAAVVCLLRAPAHRALQPPHVGLLRGWSKTPTLTARSEDDPERGQFHDEQAESICHPRDPGRRFDPHS